jgi:hypothetical protein
MKGATMTLEQVTSILAHQRAKKKSIEMGVNDVRFGSITDIGVVQIYVKRSAI